MLYENIRPATFIDRPNRFIANIELNGERVRCHVKNTGRCKELLVSGAEIFVQLSDSPNRKTPCDLIAVRKGDRLINMDANAPNRVFGEFLARGGLGEVPALIKPECTHGDSRFDFYFESGGIRSFAEIKGVTLEENGVVRFPDAPTLRGVKHLRGLMWALGEGYESYAVFIVQMSGVKWFEPNEKTHPEFAQALREAQRAGVHILCYDCRVTQTSLAVDKPVSIKL